MVGMMINMSIYIKWPERIQGINERELFIEETFPKHREKMWAPHDCLEMNDLKRFLTSYPFRLNYPHSCDSVQMFTCMNKPVNESTWDIFLKIIICYGNTIEYPKMGVVQALQEFRVGWDEIDGVIVIGYDQEW